MDTSSQRCSCTSRPMRPQNMPSFDHSFEEWWKYSILSEESFDNTTNPCQRNETTKKMPFYQRSETFGKCGMMPGMTYVPWQEWGSTYPLTQAITRGTIFPDLDYPFEMGRCR